MKHWLCVVVFGALLAACGGGGGDDDTVQAGGSCEVIGLQPKIINGVRCEDATTAAVVRVVAERNGQVQPICTATMVSPREALGAAHCFVGSSARRFGVVVGAALTGPVIWADEVLYPSAYPGVGERASFDVAVLRLESAAPLGQATIPMLTSSAWQGAAEAFVYGYGQSAQGETSDVPDEAIDFSDLESGTMQIEGSTSSWYFVRFDGRGQNVCFGDSGGPLVVVTALGPVVIGVVSQASRNDCRAGDVTSYTNLSDPGLRVFFDHALGEGRRL